MFSIIIPTYNRGNILGAVLNAYIKQTYKKLIKEIIIIDDGSTDDTRSIVDNFSKSSPFKIIYLYQDNRGPAEARNKGIYIASGDIILMTGDDIVPHSDIIKEHFNLHKNYNFNKNICILGKVVWSSDMKVTPFMKYIQEMGLQFGYSIIPNENGIPFDFFYTSNISLSRDFLIEDKLFDTEFPYAAWEDIEMAYRLTKRGLRIIYNKNALGYHHHKISFASYRERQHRSGYAACIFYDKHPELKDFLGINSSNPPIIYRWIINLAELFCLFADRYFPISFPRLYDLVMNYHYHVGMKNYINESRLSV